MAIAAPVGPIGLLCINRTLHHGPVRGLATGLGAATADAVYASIGVVGMGVLIGRLTALATPLAMLGSVVLLSMGIATLRGSSVNQMAKTRAGGTVWGAYGSALLLTLTNPMTILSFMAIFAGMTAGHSSNGHEATIMVLGIFSGSSLWWLALAYGAGRWLMRLGADGRQWVDRLSGLLLIAFAGGILWRLLAHAIEISGHLFFLGR